MTQLRILSLGWGVQSWALAAMSALGVLPQIDAAVHADTFFERSATYGFAQKWTPWLEERGVKIITVSDKKHHGGAIDEWGGIFLPLFTRTKDGEPAGMLRRQCTQRWKIYPVRRWIAAELERRELKKTPGVVEQWLGITLDEVARVKSSGVQYIKNALPFMQMLDHPWTRHDAVLWLRENNLEIPVKSSCVMCPYHDRETWRKIRREGGDDWHLAVKMDNAIRHKRPGFLCYLTPERRPLIECDFRSEQEHGQLELWTQEECSGTCFM
jgi:hypothetical protein